MNGFRSAGAGTQVNDILFDRSFSSNMQQTTGFDGKNSNYSSFSSAQENAFIHSKFSDTNNDSNALFQKHEQRFDIHQTQAPNALSGSNNITEESRLKEVDDDPLLTARSAISKVQGLLNKVNSMENDRLTLSRTGVSKNLAERIQRLRDFDPVNDTSLDDITGIQKNNVLPQNDSFSSQSQSRTSLDSHEDYEIKQHRKEEYKGDNGSMIVVEIQLEDEDCDESPDKYTTNRKKTSDNSHKIQQVSIVNYVLEEDKLENLIPGESSLVGSLISKISMLSSNLLKRLLPAKYNAESAHGREVYCYKGVYLDEAFLSSTGDMGQNIKAKKTTTEFVQNKSDKNKTVRFKK